MLELYTWTTPNGQKISVMLEELGIPYHVHLINLGQGQQFNPEFLAISPNNKIPAIVDDSAEGGRLSLFESGAILTYLAEKHGRFLAPDGPARYQTLEWLYWQIGGIGPIFGQVSYFEKFAAQKSPLASARFLAEAERLLKVMDTQLSTNTYLAGADYSIADIACYPWVITAATFLHDAMHGHFANKPGLQRWLELIGQRPAVQRGMAVPKI